MFRTFVVALALGLALAPASEPRLAAAPEPVNCCEKRMDCCGRGYPCCRNPKAKPCCAKGASCCKHTSACCRGK